MNDSAITSGTLGPGNGLHKWLHAAQTWRLRDRDHALAPAPTHIIPGGTVRIGERSFRRPRGTPRANLRFVARALKMPLWPEPSPIARSGPALSYSPEEIAAYFALARRQTTARHRAMEAMLCLGLGAGLDGWT
jgi:hypothetical protein